MTKRPAKSKRLKEAYPADATPTEEEKERADQRLVRLGLFILTYHLQKFVENRALQTLLKEHDLAVSWDAQKKGVVVVASPRRPAKSRKE